MSQYDIIIKSACHSTTSS